MNPYSANSTIIFGEFMFHHVYLFNTFIRIETEDKDAYHDFLRPPISTPSVVWLCVCVCLYFIFLCVHCPEALQIQAAMPKHGQGGGNSGGVWAGGRRTVQQVTFDPLLHCTDNPWQPGGFDGWWQPGATTVPVSLVPAKASSALIYGCENDGFQARCCYRD